MSAGEVEGLAELLATQEWAADWPHHIVPPGKPAQELACRAIRALPFLLASAARVQALESENTALRTINDKFARHNGMCGIFGGYGYCTCGLDDARSTLNPEIVG
jgi:hypothetical protein